MKVKTANSHSPFDPTSPQQQPPHNRSHHFVPPASPAQHHHQPHHHRDSVSISDYYSDNEPPATSAGAAAHQLLSSPTTNNNHRHHNVATKYRRTAAASANEDDDDSDSQQSVAYQRAIELIVLKCESLSADNERLVHRLHYVKKITKRQERDVAILKRRLDLYNDGWRTAQPEPLFRSDMPTLIPADNNVIVRKKYKKREKPAAAVATTAIEPVPFQEDTVEAVEQEQPRQQQQQQVQLQPPAPEDIVIEIASATTSILNTAVAADPIVVPASPAPSTPLPKTPKTTSATATATTAKVPKRKRPKTDREKDPNAPKRPANPFFQFCQEQRSILMGELNSELLPGQPELSKQELTRQLANRWRSLDAVSKQIYNNMYEISKQKYNEEMRAYRDGGGGGGGGGSRRTTEAMLQ